MNFHLKALFSNIKPFPIWFMRQSGRYLPDYRKLREKYSFMEIIRNPELIAHLTTLPLKYFDLDMLIIFSDISVIFSLINGVEYDIVDSKGPVTKIVDYKKMNLKQSSSILESLKIAIKLVKSQQKIPLIGFTSGIYTAIYYLFDKDKRYIYGNEDILFLITDCIYEVIKVQVEAGVDIIQIFDTYLFELSPFEIEFFIIPYYKILFSRLKSNFNVPIIFFSLNTINIINYLFDLKVNGLSVDWRSDLKIYFEKFPGYVQGNLDPYILTLENKEDFIKILNLSIFRIFANIDGYEERYIFNLGHGILPNTKIDNVKYLIEIIKRYKGG